MKLTKAFSSATLSAILTLMLFCGALVASPAPAPQLVQATANHTTGAASTLSLSFPANTAAGDTVLVGFDFDTNASLSSLSDSQGNAFSVVGAPLTTPGGAQMRVYYAQNIKGGADTVTVNFSGSSAYIEVYLTEYAGLNPTSPIDAQAGATGNAGSVSSGTVRTTVAGDVIYGYCAGDWACTVGAGFVTRSTFDSNLIEDMSAGAPGTYAATASASSGWAMQMVALKPAATTGNTPVASLSASSLNFGNQTVNATSAAQALTLTNTGNTALNLTSIALTGKNSGDFAQTNTCGASVAAGANCAINVTVRPSATGTRTATLTLSDNATGGQQTVSLTGTGTAAVVGVSPSSLSFASQAVGTASAVQAVTLSNSGNAVLTISSIILAGANASDFALLNGCGSSVGIKASCTLSVSFKPSTAGTRTATITLTDNAMGSPQKVTLTGTATGTGPVASLSPSSLVFPSQAVGATGAAQTVSLTNTGNAVLNITSITLSGANATDFVQTSNCGLSVAAGANCTISVSFTPASSGSRVAVLSVSDNAAGGSQSVSLSGTGASASPTVSFSPSSLTFGGEPVQMTSSVQAVTLTNTGTTTVSVSALAVTGANASDFVQTNTCTSVAAGSTCTIAVLFTPSATGARTASLSVSDNAGGSPQSVSLSGSGNHDVTVTWTDSTTPGVVGYNVYRGTTPGGEGSTPVNSAPVNSTNFMDQTVTPGATYYYVVMAIAADDVTQSPASTETTATIPTT
jgi:hypothetical protein